ncbi:hypothetical protein MMC09_006892 [Bachmanniomyces sp. S44760]|nr:hypothetical protein [Bachmanniomyces sp. S44760]
MYIPEAIRRVGITTAARPVRPVRPVRPARPARPVPPAPPYMFLAISRPTRNMTLSLLFALLLASPTSSLPSESIFHVSIDESPAPAPGDGPPIAASAIRDISFLPVQIGCILAAYAFAVLIIGTALFTVGRRLRRSAETSPQSLGVEMMKPMQHNGQCHAGLSYDHSPVSPQKKIYDPSPVSTMDMKAGWPSRNGSVNNWPRQGHKSHVSIQSSVYTADESVISDHKARNEMEMERLYAAVMEHEEKKEKSKSQVSQNPPELQHLRHASPPYGLNSPPNETLVPSRTTTVSPGRTGSKLSRASPGSIMTGNHSRASSRSSLASFANRKSRVRRLTISPPMGSPDLVPDQYSRFAETEPLSPRHYSPGPPPPAPPQRQTSNASQQNIEHGGTAPKSIQNAHVPAFQLQRSPPCPTPNTAWDFTPKPPQAPKILEPQRDQSAPPPTIQFPRLQSPPKQSRRPAPLPLRTNSDGLSATGTHALPLRSAPLPLRTMNLRDASNTSTRSPSAIKATVIERKVETHLQAPRTGVPSTPYTPYMPQTPLTPMTPSRLVTRAERKRKEKEEGRRVATTVDAVQEEGDMWGDAYA